MVPGQATVSTIDMSPLTSDVTVPATTRWEAGDLVPFTLHFEHSGRAEARPWSSSGERDTRARDEGTTRSAKRLSMRPPAAPSRVGSEAEHRELNQRWRADYAGSAGRTRTCTAYRWGTHSHGVLTPGPG
ncbi:hypothetical protein GCM10010095_61720 [Streptomyces anthocyanicus]|nr:hypothetical protein GCM10010095_61720 [Streptomyces anthocyanicus]